MAKFRGIVTYYDGTYGEIKAQDDKYIFLNKDMDDVTVKKGVIVSFNGEEVQGTKRAYFVSNLENTNNILETNKKKIKELS